MPNIYTMMDISRWALNASTRQLDTVSHNVANVDNPDYSRQEVVLATRTPEFNSEGWYGRGVQVTNVIQMVDRLLLERITDKLSSQEYYDAQLTQLSRIEALSNEVGDTGLGEQITAFFNAWQEVSNNPESSAVREVLKETAANLASRMDTLTQDLLTIQKDMNAYLLDATSEVNSICKRIAKLNDDILQAEATGKSANDLRDERVGQLNDLAELINIDWFEEADGNVVVQTGQGKTIVQAGYPSASDPDPLSFQSVAGYDQPQLVWRDVTGVVLDTGEITGGKMGAWLTVRDEDLSDTMDFLNDLAGSLVFEVNKLHSSGIGLDKITDVTGTYECDSATVAFNDSANTLAYADEVTTGNFDIWVYENGTRRDYSISVTASDTMTTIMNKINLAMGDGGPANLDPAVNPVASLTSDNAMRINATGGIEFGFANDTSNLLAVLGINTFFEGNTATNIAVNDTINSSVRSIAAGRIQSDGEHALGDNSNALDLADLKDSDTMNGDTETFNESVITWSANLGTKIAASEDNLTFSMTSVQELTNQRDNVSAVNLDEEMVKMIRYQRAYQMAAKMISVADSLMTTLIETKR